MKGGSVGLYGRRGGDVIVSLQDGSQGEQDAGDHEGNKSRSQPLLTALAPTACDGLFLG